MRMRTFHFTCSPQRSSQLRSSQPRWSRCLSPLWLTAALSTLALFAGACGGGGSACPEGFIASAGACVATPDGGSDGAVLDGATDAGSDGAVLDGATDGGSDGCTTMTYYADTDSDGFGDPAASMEACSAPAGHVSDNTDCNDTRGAVHPGGTEVCDGLDDDCNGTVDDGLTTMTYYADTDSDGFGDPGASMDACSAPTGYVSDNTDCNDSSDAAHPGGTEVCDGLDRDCDGSADNGLTPPACALTAGVCMGTTEMCGGALGWVACTAASYPASYESGAETRCDGLDNNCDGSTDEGTRTMFYADCDGDGARDALVSHPACDTAEALAYLIAHGHAGCIAVLTGSAPEDCDDALASVHPGATEVCNGRDDDCDGTIDGASATTWCNAASRALPHATAACTAGSCSVASCSAGYDDCDSGDANGCEASLNSDDANCGACRNVCALGAGSCSAGAAGTCDDAVQVEAGYANACLLRASGVVDCWGWNRDGQLGDGTTTNRNRLTRVTGLSNVTAIAAGPTHMCALLSTGSVRCWGHNVAGQLGDGTTTERHTPVSVAGLSNVTAITAGFYHTCALLGTGAVKCWGRNTNGQLGDGTTIDHHLPVTVDATNLGAATQVAAGGNHTCAVKSGSGGSYCWGSNNHGQLGNNRTTDSRVPAFVLSFLPFQQLSLGAEYSCGFGVRLDGTQAVFCWGLNAEGQLGKGDLVDSDVPTTVLNLTNPINVSAGRTHACATLASGAIRCWGRGTSGELGDTATVSHTSPVTVASMSDGRNVAGGSDSTCALRATGGVSCWGSNTYGQLGDGTNVSRTSPVVVVP